MGNLHPRVNLAVLLFLIVTFSSEVHPLEDSSATKQKNKESTNGTESSGVSQGHPAWPAVLGALTAVFFTALFIAVAVRYRLVRWCLSRNTHGLLLEGEAGSHAGDTEGEMPVRGMRGRMVLSEESSGEEGQDEDDDGFIEDNYIPACARKKAEEELQEEDSDDELITAE
ncbi:hypothetical protein DNTS_015851 [Danionella cerebrum]|uniref:Uncharacterized protein n=1 Tax=Danionella cerebrum TaxID=2873325 RepID=A0A553Q6D0_9TELE|nr:hypothetical protein DNTS_015851 [Danionella translucida]